MHSLEAWRAGACVSRGQTSQTGSGVLAGVGAADVKVRLELAVAAVVARLALAGVARVIGTGLHIQNTLC